MTETVKPGDELKFSYRDPGDVAAFSSKFHNSLMDFPTWSVRCGAPRLDFGQRLVESRFGGGGGGGGVVNLLLLRLTKYECPQETELNLSFWEG